MTIKYDVEIENEVIIANLRRITNQVYKLLPSREEGSDWEKPLSTLQEELAGMNELLFGQQDKFFSILCKLEGLFELNREEDFFLFRRTIFDCLGLINELTEGIRNG